jgi:antitoxin PrlF
MHVHYHPSYWPTLHQRKHEMPATLEVESTLTERYQTTVPATVRRALRLGRRDKIHYSIRPSGEVVLTRAVTPAASDPALGAFLDFLAQDIRQNPARLQALDAAFAQRIRRLTAGVAIDLDAPLSQEDE